MPNLGIGALGYFGYAPEVTDGTRVAPTKFLAVRSANFNDSNDYLTPLQVRGSRDITVAMVAPFTIQGTVELDLPIRDIGDILKAAFAAAVQTSSYSGGGYTHVLTPGNTSGSLSVETSAADTLVMGYAGNRVNTLQVKSTFGEIVQATIGFSGTSRAAYSAATPSYHSSSLTPLHFTGATVSIGGSANNFVKEFTFGINNNVEHIGTLRATRSYRRVALGPRELTLDMSIDFDDTTEYNRLLNDTEFAVSLYLEGPAGIGAGGTTPQSITIDLPRVKYRTVGIPITASGFLTQDVTCTILKPSGSDIATVTVNNAETGAQFAS